MRLAAGLALILSLVLAGPARAQCPTGAVAPLSFLVGEWSGEGWFLAGETRQSVFISETFEPRIGGAALLAEPVYRERRADGTAGPVLRQAIAVFLADPRERGAIQLRTLFASGASGQFRVTQAGTRLEWDVSSPDEPGRWVMELGSDGVIREHGEFQRAGRWERVFEMRMRRVSAPAC